MILIYQPCEFCVFHKFPSTGRREAHIGMNGRGGKSVVGGFFQQFDAMLYQQYKLALTLNVKSEKNIWRKLYSITQLLT